MSAGGLGEFVSLKEMRGFCDWGTGARKRAKDESREAAGPCFRPFILFQLNAKILKGYIHREGMSQWVFVAKLNHQQCCSGK